MSLNTKYPVKQQNSLEKKKTVNANKGFKYTINSTAHDNNKNTVKHVLNPK